MPIYEYRCEKCDHTFVRTEHMDDHAKKHPRCPECKSTKVRQMFGAFMAKTSKKS